MRSAFGLLESLVALMVFSVVILVCSQTLLQIQKDMKLIKDRQSMQNALFYTATYVQNQLRYALISSISPSEIRYFEVNGDLFFAPDFSPSLDRCNSHRIPKLGSSKFVAFFSPSPEIASVLREDKHEMILDRQAKCGAMIPLLDQRRIFLSQDQTLYLDRFPLLHGVRRFEFKQEGEGFRMEICLDSCLSYGFRQDELFYAF